MQLPLSAPLPVKGRMRTTTCVPLSNVHYMLLHADSYFSTFTFSPAYLHALKIQVDCMQTARNKYLVTCSGLSCSCQLALRREKRRPVPAR